MRLQLAACGSNTSSLARSSPAAGVIAAPSEREVRLTQRRVR
jgi:hypothetical protein